MILEMNGVTLRYQAVNAVTTMLALAAGDLDDDAFTAWVRERASR